MALFGSTSPAYPVMASLDLARDWAMEQGKTAWNTLAAQMAKIKETARTRGFLLPEGETDPTRLAIGTLPLGMTGEEAAQWFRERGIEPEHEDGAYVVFIATPWNREEELTRLEMAVAQFPGEAQPVSPAPALPPLPPVRCSPREAVLAPQERLSLEGAVGRIAGEAACPCPPGVPIVMPGEEVTPECAGFLREYGLTALSVVK